MYVDFWGFRRRTASTWNSKFGHTQKWAWSRVKPSSISTLKTQTLVNFSLQNPNPRQLQPSKPKPSSITTFKTQTLVNLWPQPNRETVVNFGLQNPNPRQFRPSKPKPSSILPARTGHPTPELLAHSEGPNRTPHEFNSHRRHHTMSPAIIRGRCEWFTLRNAFANFPGLPRATRPGPCPPTSTLR
jgi:hypothetical protein